MLREEHSVQGVAVANIAKAFVLLLYIDSNPIWVPGGTNKSLTLGKPPTLKVPQLSSRTWVENQWYEAELDL